MTKKSNYYKARYLILSFLLIQLFVTSVSTSANLQSTSTELEWPKITNQTKPWTRWWWLGNIVNRKDLAMEMEKYQKAGLGGLEITPIYGVKGYEDRFINYLSPPWMEMLDHTLKEANKLGMGVDIATGTGWPFGGPWVGADDACKNVVHKTYALKGGESLNEPVVYMQKPLVRAIGRRVNISELKEPISANENLQALALDQVRFEKPLPLHLLMAYSNQGEMFDLTDKVDGSGKLGWVAPAGNWTLYAVFQGWHGKMVERAGPGGEGNVIDHFSDQALKNYLRRFDQAFSGLDIRSLRAFFNDSYEVDDADGESTWTPNFFAEFNIRRGYDLRRH
ncbi:MAG: glycoside hydrolase family 2 protein, partial [Acidobacteria bacterium]|nr:glycoside hydrolase family 2 protein [Acidobacteriota bacterium]